MICKARQCGTSHEIQTLATELNKRFPFFKWSAEERQPTLALVFTRDIRQHDAGGDGRLVCLEASRPTGGSASGVRGEGWNECEDNAEVHSATAALDSTLKNLSVSRTAFHQIRAVDDAIRMISAKLLHSRSALDEKGVDGREGTVFQ